MDEMNEKRFVSLVNELKNKKNINIDPIISLNQIFNDTNLLDRIIDEILLDEFCQFGLKADSEPNEYGFYIEEIITFLNKIRLFGPS